MATKKGLSPIELLRARLAERKQGGKVKAEPPPAPPPKKGPTKNTRRRELIETCSAPPKKSKVSPVLAKMRHSLARKKEGLPEVMEGEAECCFCKIVAPKKTLIAIGNGMYKHMMCGKPKTPEAVETAPAKLFAPCPVPEMVISCKHLKREILAEMCPVFSGVAVKGCSKCPVDKAGIKNPAKLKGAITAKAKYDSGFKTSDFVAFLRSVHSLMQGG